MLPLKGYTVMTSMHTISCDWVVVTSRSLVGWRLELHTSIKFIDPFRFTGIYLR